MTIDSAQQRRHITVLAIVSLALLIQISPYWIPTPDAACYLSIARSIADGNGLTCFGSEHIYYAPGYPVLIAPVFTLFGRSFLAMSILHWLWLVLFMVAVYIWAKRLCPAYSLHIAILSAANVAVMYYFRRTLSEAAFLPLMMASGYWLNALADPRQKSVGLQCALAVSALMLLCAVRQAGLMLSAGFVMMMVVMAIKRCIPWKRALFLAAIIGFGAVLMTGLLVHYDRTMAARVGSDHMYIHQMVDSQTTIAGQLLDGLRLRIQEIGRIMIPGAYKVYGDWLNPSMILYVPLFIAVLLGWVRLIRQSDDCLLYAFPFYLVLYLIWPYDQGCRFMVPFLALFWLALITIITRFTKKKKTASIVTVLIILNAITSFVYLIRDVHHAKELNSVWTSVRDVSKQWSPSHEPVSMALPSELRIMVQLYLDKQLTNIKKDQPIPAQYSLILTRPQKEIPSNFTPHYTNNHLLLLKRPPH